MFDKIKTFYGISKPVPPLQCGPKERDRLYRRLRFQSFLAGTVGYSLYYVCRTTLNVVKKPVSYTHLDVYKRQVPAAPWRSWASSLIRYYSRYLASNACSTRCWDKIPDTGTDYAAENQVLL